MPTRAELLQGIGPTKSDVINTGRKGGVDRSSILKAAGQQVTAAPRTYSQDIDSAITSLREQGILSSETQGYQMPERFGTPIRQEVKEESRDARETPDIAKSIVLKTGEKILRAGVAIPASTAMEIMDGFTGEGFSPVDWFNQSITEPISWGSVRDKHPNVYWAMAVPTAGLSLIPAGLDLAGWESAADLSADFMFDIWNLAGGLNKFVGVTKGRSGIQKALFESTTNINGPVKFTGAMADAARAASVAMDTSKGNSISAAIRVLKQTKEGREVMRQMDLVPGLRLRLPGTGTATRVLGLDKLPGLAPLIAKRRAKQVPEFWKVADDGAVISDDVLAAEILKASKARRPGGVMNMKNRIVPEGTALEKLGYAATKMPVEMVAPLMGTSAMGLGGAAALKVMDSPIRATKQVKKMIGEERVAKFATKFGAELFAGAYKFLDVLKQSDSPAAIWLGNTMKEVGRRADMMSRDFTANVELKVQRALDEAELDGISAESLSELASFDPFIRAADGTIRARQPGLGPEFANVTDERLETLYDLSRQVADYSAEMNIGIRGEDFKMQVDEVLDSEGGYVPRMVTPEGKELLDVAGDDLPLGVNLQGRFDAGNLRDRQVKVGGHVDVKVTDPDWVPPAGVQVLSSQIVDGKLVRVVRVVDTVLPPKQVGKSVAKQVNDMAESIGLPKIYEESFAKVWGRYANVVGDDFRMRVIENNMTKYGLLLENEQLGVDELLAIRKKIQEVKPNIKTAKANVGKARAEASKMNDLRKKWWKQNVRPLLNNDPEGLELAVKMERAFTDTANASAELEVIQAELDVVRQQLVDISKNVKRKNLSLNDPQYQQAMSKALDLQARVRVLKDFREARDAVIDTLTKMRDLEAGYGPIGKQPIEVRALLRAERGVQTNEEMLPLDALKELQKTLDEQLDFLENEVMPSIYDMAERYGLGTVEAQALGDLVKASKGNLPKGRRMKTETKIRSFNDSIAEFKKLDAELGFENLLSTANSGLPIEVQAAKALADLDRQSQWLRAQFAAIGSKDELVTLNRGIDLPTGRFEEPAEVITLKKKLELDFISLTVRKAEMLEGLAKMEKIQQDALEKMQKRFAQADVERARGDAASARYEEEMGKVAKYEAEAQRYEFDEMIPLYKKFADTLDNLAKKAKQAGVNAEAIGLQINQAYDDLMDGIQALGAQPVLDSKENLDLLNKVMNASNRRWGGYHTILDTNLDVSADQVRQVLESFKSINHRESSSKYVRYWDTIQRFLKSQQLATPGFVARNTQGAIWNAAQKGVNPSMLARSFKMLRRAFKVGEGDAVRGVQILADQGEEGYPAMLELINAGVLRSGQGAQSVEASLEVETHFATKIYARKGGVRKGQSVRREWNPMRPEFVFNKGIRTANNMVEDSVRLGTGLDVLAEGGSLDDAMNMIVSTQFDYNELSAGERYLKQFVFPFWTWTRKNLPLQLSMMYRHPGKLNRLLSIKENIERMSEKEDTVPAYFMQPFGIRLPFAPGGSQTYFVPDLPFIDLFRADPFGDDFGVPQLLSEVTPALKFIPERYLQKQFFKGIPISDRYQKMPANFGNIPGLKQALELLPGNIVKNGKMRANNIYMVEQLVPMIGRLRRIAPVEDKYQGHRQLQSFLSMALGLPVRFNTEEMKSSTRYQKRLKRSEERRDVRDLADANR